LLEKKGYKIRTPATTARTGRIKICFGFTELDINLVFLVSLYFGIYRIVSIYFEI
jgi:hypothetical protein